MIFCAMPRTLRAHRAAALLLPPIGDLFAMTPFRLTLLISLCTLLSTDLRAQDPDALTPEEGVQMALEEHGLLRSAEAQAREARAAYQQARSAWWPSISSQASYTRLSDNIPPIGGQLPGIDTTFTIAPIELNRFHTEISVEQPLFTGFQRGSRIRAAERRAEAADEDVAQQRADVALEVRQAYWTLAQAQARRNALETSLEQVEVHLQDVRNRLEAGAALESHVLAAETRRSEVRLDQLEAEQAVQAARLELNRLIGASGGISVYPQTEVDMESMAESPKELTAEALDEHPELSALREQIGAFEAELRATRWQWLPEAVLTGRYVYARPNQYFFAEQDRFHGSWEAGVVFRWELWDGGRRAAETDQAEARLQGAEARLDYRREQLEVEITRRYLDVESAREAVELARQNVRQAEESFRVARQQFEAGAALSADVLEAEAALRAAQSREAEALATYAIARATLLNALGRVW